MTCESCGAAAAGATCGECRAEDELFGAYREAIDVPPMWEAIASQIAHERRTRRRFVLAAAAAIVIAAIGALLVVRRHDDVTPLVVAKYREAIRANAAPADAALLRDLDAAIVRTERTRRADDPMIVAAYDAKLQFLRATRHD